MTTTPKQSPEIDVSSHRSDTNQRPQTDHVAHDATAPQHDLPVERPDEHGGQTGPEPTRFGDWEKKGRCTDF